MALTQDPRSATAALAVTEAAVDGSAPIAWTPRLDLLGSDRQATDLVVEMEDDGSAQLRFGDGVNGRAVPLDVPMSAVYRVGNGSAGNIGRDTLGYLAAPTGQPVNVDLARISAVGNPLPAEGGSDPEPIDTVRLLAPHAYRRQERCVIEADYVTVAQSHPLVSQAVATFRWSGSWYTTEVVVDRSDGRAVDAALRADLLTWFEPYRLLGADLQIRGPVPVAPQIVIQVGVRDGYRADLIERDLLARFGTAHTLDGAPAFFNPTRFGIGRPLYLSQLIQTAAGAPGVAWAEVLRLERRGEGDQGELGLGVLTIGRREALRAADGDVTVITTDAGEVSSR
jgi:predicted phage baseplate assembly protein